MIDQEAKALQGKEKSEVPAAPEQTRPGPIFTPAVDIFETDTAITLLADIPGVEAENLDIDLRNDVLTLGGDVSEPGSPDETGILREYRTGKHIRQFALSETVDQSKIEAELKDGVLRLVLPKAEKAVPRKIKVKAA